MEWYSAPVYKQSEGLYHVRRFGSNVRARVFVFGNRELKRSDIIGEADEQNNRSSFIVCQVVLINSKLRAALNKSNYSTFSGACTGMNHMIS